MTATQKFFVSAALAAAVGAGVYEAHRASIVRRQAGVLQQQQAALTGQIEQLTQERDDAAPQVAATTAALAAEREQARAGQTELLRLRNEVGLLRQQNGALRGGRADPPVVPAAAAAATENREEEMRQLGLAASRGDLAALERLSELSTLASQGRTNVNQDTHGDIRIAFKVMGEEAGKGNETAFEVLWRATRMKTLSGMAIMALGQAAGMGNERALEPLLDPERYLLLPSTTLFALKPAAESGNERAIQAIASVAANPKQQALWYGAANNLQKPAEAGNATAIDALAMLGRAENTNVSRVARLALENAAFNKHAKAIEALRSLGYQKK
jgi:hypothetical protein